MSPNSAPFAVWVISVCYIAACDSQPSVANVIVDGSSPLPRSLTTADSKCQFCLLCALGESYGELGFDLETSSFVIN